jgi:hypothetical protein
MKLSHLTLISLMSSVCWVQAQEASYDGKWQASFEGSAVGASREGTVSISGKEGTWDMAVRSRKDPCIGRPYPITVQRATAEELVFDINRSKTLMGCKDGTAKLKRVDDKTLEGEFDGGRKLTLKRE